MIELTTVLGSFFTQLNWERGEESVRVTDETETSVFPRL